MWRGVIRAGGDGSWHLGPDLSGHGARDLRHIARPLVSTTHISVVRRGFSFVSSALSGDPARSDTRRKGLAGAGLCGILQGQESDSRPLRRVRAAAHSRQVCKAARWGSPQGLNAVNGGADRRHSTNVRLHIAAVLASSGPRPGATTGPRPGATQRPRREGPVGSSRLCGAQSDSGEPIRAARPAERVFSRQTGDQRLAGLRNRGPEAPPPRPGSQRPVLRRGGRNTRGRPRGPELVRGVNSLPRTARLRAPAGTRARALGQRRF